MTNDRKSDKHLIDEACPEPLRDDRLAGHLFHPGNGTIQAVQQFRVVKDTEGNAPSIAAQLDRLRGLAEAAGRGDQTQSKKMLTAQMVTLDVLFHSLARKAGTNLNGGYLEAGEMFLKLAFKAQAQARATAEALNDVINPRTTSFVRQTNIAENQQINHGSRADKSENPPNELLEKNDGNRLEPGAQRASSENDSALATVGKSDRAANTRRKSSGKP